MEDINENIMDFLKKSKPEIDRTIEKYLPKEATQEWLEFAFGKPRYKFNTEAVQKSLVDPIWDFLERGGKRWRPVGFLLVVEAVGGDSKKLKDFVIIPEIIHNGTIMIDDVEDLPMAGLMMPMIKINGKSFQESRVLKKQFIESLSGKDLKNIEEMENETNFPQPC